MERLCSYAIATAIVVAAMVVPRAASAANSEVEAIVAEALDRSPAVAAARIHYEALTRVPSQVATLPDPEVSFQQLTVGGPKPFEGYETSDFFYSGFGLTQEIPWPGKLRLRGQVASHDADGAREEYEAVRREVAEKVRENVFELFFIGKRLGLLSASRGQLFEIGRFSEDQYRLGKGNQADVIKAQVAATAMLKEIELARNELTERQVALKSIMGRDSDSRDLPIPEITATTIAKPASRDRLIALAAETPSDVQMALHALLKSEMALELAHEDYIPDFSLGYTYQKTGPGFRDYYMLTLGAKIPLYFWRKQKPAVEQAALEREAAKNQLRASKLAASSAVERYWIELQTQERVIALYRDGLLPQSRAAVDSAMASYRTGRTDFQTLLSAAAEQLNVNQEYYRAIADHEIAIAHIEQLAGESL